MRHLAVVIAVVCFAAALYSPLSAQTPPESTPASLPDEFGGEIFDCEIASNPTGSGDVEIEESHVTHLCADNHTHSWWNSGGSAVGLYEQYGRAHTHSKKAVTAGPGVYQPQEIAPGEDFIIDAPVISGPRVCSEPGPRPSAHKRGEAWGMLNCEVKRVVETIVAATFGVSLLGVAWAGIHIISTPASEGKSRGRQLLWSSVIGLVVVMCCYIFASLIDLGVNFYIPWDIVPR